MVAVKRLRASRGLNQGKSMRSAVMIGGKVTVVDHGAIGASIKPGTAKGDSYCARSSKIKMTPKNVAARAAWNCAGKKSKKSRPAMYGGNIPQKKINEALRRRGLLKGAQTRNRRTKKKSARRRK